MRLIPKQWRHIFHGAASVLLALTVVMASATDADAARKHRGGTKSKKATVAAASRAATGTKDPRYADIIMNPVTGEVYHQDGADERRYPASLTKMMTLYLLFEALDQNKVSMNTHLDISDYATTMPQTNLSLSSGDTIPVEIAIKALVVRSANDVAVVVAEALGGDADRFAQMMTNKARALGMRNTIFKNPNGLPNNGQVTTARDMAKLGIALKRDFPQYYDYFATRQFSWNGVTYYTHNRVMLRYAGTDGIKTGFIGLSGFNVVTSVTRGGRPLVGTVMGGGSGGWRDNRMIELLDNSYQIIAERGASRGKMYLENLPLKRNPKTGASKGVGLESRGFVEENSTMPETLPEERATQPVEAAEDGVSVQETQPPQVAPQVMAVTAAAPVMATAAAVGAAPQMAYTGAGTPPPVHVSTPITLPAATAPTAAAPQGAPTAANNYIRLVSIPPKAATATTASTSVARPQVAPPVAPMPPAPPMTPVKITQPVPAAAIAKAASQPVVAKAGIVWGIQVGAFSSNDLATRAVNDAYGLAKPSLTGAQMAIAGPEAAGAPVYRARMGNLNEAQAKAACQTLIAHSTPCFAYKVR